MRGIDTGTVLADRYVLEELLAQRDETLDYWSATDRTLDRLVAVTVLPASGQFEEMAHAVLDGARRTAGVDDPRLVRVLDVGLDEGFCWIVEEGLSEAESLASLVSQHPLPAEEARRIVGEAASGLESARRRGLHHLYLNPHAVLRTSEGSVKVSGIGVAAAIEQVDDVTADEATLIDTGDLLSLLYTGLTGRWPGEQIEGLRGARRLADGSLPAPSEVVSGVPGDLDALCRMTFGAEYSADQGPRTPGELARRLAPWPSEMVTGTGGQAFGPDSPLAGLGADASLAGAAGAGAAITSTSSAQDDPDSSATGFATGAGDDTGWSGQDQWETDGEAARASGPVEQDHTTVVEPAYYRTEVGTPGSEGGTSASGSGAAAGPDADFDEGRSPAIVGAGLSGATADRTSERRQSGVVLALIAAILVVAVFLAYGAFRGLLPGNEGPTEAATGASAAPSTDDGAQTSAAAGGDSSEQTQAEPSRDATLEPIELAGITSYDPEGDGDERNDVVDLAIDGNQETAWNSHTYLAANWGNLKSGVGLLVDLEESQEVSEVDLDFPRGDYAVEVYVTDEETREGATSIGARDDASGEVTFTADEPATGRYVLIWFSRAWDGPDGEIVYLSEVAVK
ncbi:MAG: protein kinase family protein [Ornithinimicrobium sp.]|uniref:protein kinase family protein n=1 Tax=Ornithinimicrobium sp. TaxID=1977084 RepID=UPI003D9BF5F0